MDPKGHQKAPKWCPGGPQNLQSGAQEGPRASKATPKRPKGLPKAPQKPPKSLPKTAQNIVNNDVLLHVSKHKFFKTFCSKVAHRRAPGPPKWCPRGPQGLQGEPQEAQRPPKGLPKASQRHSKSPPRGLQGPSKKKLHNYIC